MSYSFSKRGATRAAVLAMVSAQFDEIVAQQPIHAADRAQAQAVAESFLAIVPDADDTQDYYIAMHGSVSYTWNSPDNTPDRILGASLGVTANLVAKETPAA